MPRRLVVSAPNEVAGVFDDALAQVYAWLGATGARVLQSACAYVQQGRQHKCVDVLECRQSGRHRRSRRDSAKPTDLA